MKQLLIVMTMMVMVICIPKKHIKINKHIKGIDANDVKLSEVDLALYQTDSLIEDQKLHSQLKYEMANWAVAKQALIQSMQQCVDYFQLFLNKQQQIGVILVLVICFAFYLMVKSEDMNMRNKSKLVKKKPQEPIYILTDSLLQQPQSQMSGSMHFDERVNKSADYKLPQHKMNHYRARSQPDILVNYDQSASEIASLLRGMN